jgi:hypothetical protein
MKRSAGMPEERLFEKIHSVAGGLRLFGSNTAGDG